ncbi:MAG: class C beta-lactamase-related serine hydrolase [Bacteroidia bacterium]|nr:MAG: class C beta-lactamase-related serine hydrolase [Bacteroidia bacterium]
MKTTKNQRSFRITNSILLFSFLSLVFISCENYLASQWTYRSPENIGDGFEIGTLEEVNLDSNLIAQAVGRIERGKHKEVHSMLIFKDGKLVLEEYFQGHKYQWDARNYHGDMVQWDRDMLHSNMSVTKSFTSACIGIAIERGFIDDVNQSIFDYLPDHQHFKTDNREYITIEHLLTMSSGLACDEWSSAHGTSANDIDRLYFECDDPISCVLEKPWWSVPGTRFTYNGEGMVVLAEILRNATGMNIEEFSMEYLFEPLGIDNTDWTQYENEMYDAAGSLRLSPRAMLKLGVTYLNNGSWDGEHVISSDWVQKSSTAYNNNLGLRIPGEDSGINGYAYSWWTSELSHYGNPIKMYRAGGWGGQEIMVFPELDMVVVFTGGNYASKTTLFELIVEYVIPAVQ